MCNPLNNQQPSTIQLAVNQIKTLIEAAIVSGGESAKNNLIRSQVPINLLHNVVKGELISQNVNANLIKPAFNATSPEICLAGYFKTKNQDVCVFPNNITETAEILNFEGILNGTTCIYGSAFAEAILSINVRSQLSSVAKNFDTLYERTFAESLNLHLRCPKMVLGEFYMIPVYEYDDSAARQNTVAFKPNTNISRHIEKYALSFNAINNRPNVVGNEFRYERVCLLIVDFNQATPIIYNTNQELIAAGLLPSTTTANIDNMNFPTFVSSLLSTYETRFGANRFT